MGNRAIRHLAKILIASKKAERLSNFVVREVVSRVRDVSHNSMGLVLTNPNPQIRSRNETFSTKEPGTLRWLESFERGSVLWDIGANVGLYSIYAAKLGCRVVAFEPSVFNLEFLARNINLNDVCDSVDVVPLAVGGVGVSINELNLTSSAWGDSQNSFGTRRGQFGKDIDVSVRYRILGISMDGLVQTIGLAPPDYIKIDVDGIEPEILESGRSVLQVVRGVLVECPAFEGGEQRVADVLRGAGLILDFEDGRNQIWKRPIAD